MQTKPLYQVLSGLILAIDNCDKNGNTEQRKRNADRVRKLVKEHFPSGSGFDLGTKIDLSESNPEKLIFQADFHHMNDQGMYDGWTEHRVTVKPSLFYGFKLMISGRNRNEIKDYMAESFDIALREEVPEYEPPAVEPSPAPSLPEGFETFCNWTIGGLDRMVAHYMKTALWSSTDQSNDQGGDPLDRNYTAENLTPETRAQMRADCVTFLRLVAEAGIDPSSFDEESAGHDLWLTRNHHGAGFWDGDWDGDGELINGQKLGDLLTEIAHKMGERDLIVDNGQIEQYPIK